MEINLGPVKFKMWRLRGASRYVIVTRRRAIKLPRIGTWHSFLTGLLDNISEQQIWRMWPQARPKIARVYYGNALGFYLVMQRVQPLTDDEWELLRNPAAFEAWRTPSDGYTIPIEHKRSSLGTVDGRIVACDYGVTDNVEARMLERMWAAE